MLFGKDTVVSNDNVYERIWKLWTMICKMIMEGLRDPNKVADLLQTVVDGACGVNKYLKHLFSGVTVNATNGTESMPGLSASGYPTSATSATVWVMILDGMIAQLFGSLGKDRRRWSNSQVAVFCRDNPDKLRGGSIGTFFELANGSVAMVYFYGDPIANVYVSFHRNVWSTKLAPYLVSLQ